MASPEDWWGTSPCGKYKRVMYRTECGYMWSTGIDETLDALQWPLSPFLYYWWRDMRQTAGPRQPTPVIDPRNVRFDRTTWQGRYKLTLMARWPATGEAIVHVVDTCQSECPNAWWRVYFRHEHFHGTEPPNRNSGSLDWDRYNLQKKRGRLHPELIRAEQAYLKVEKAKLLGLAVPVWRSH